MLPTPHNEISRDILKGNSHNIKHEFSDSSKAKNEIYTMNAAVHGQIECKHQITGQKSTRNYPFWIHN